MSITSIITWAPTIAPIIQSSLNSLSSQYKSSGWKCQHTASWYYTATWSKAGNGCPSPFFSYINVPTPGCALVSTFPTTVWNDYFSCTAESSRSIISTINGGTVTNKDIPATTQAGGTTTITSTTTSTQANIITVRTTKPTVTSTRTVYSTETKAINQRAQEHNDAAGKATSDVRATSNSTLPQGLFRRSCSGTSCKGGFCCKLPPSLS